jgi:predicted nucleotidyltransferase component of viral defense system
MAGQAPVDRDTKIAGLRVASLRDLAATKIKVIGDRGELRDYFDLMVIEQRTPVTVETALVDYQGVHVRFVGNDLCLVCCQGVSE